MNGLPANQTAEADDRPRMARIGDTPRLTDRAYRALKDYITSLSIYDQPGEVRIDERQLAENLGISRTPVREAVVQLEREGFVRSVPRRGIYIIRKTKRDLARVITLLRERSAEPAPAPAAKVSVDTKPSPSVKAKKPAKASPSIRQSSMV